MTLHSDEMRHIDEAPEQRRRLVRTRAGIIIGGAYTPPPHAASADAERIQSALLDPATAGRLPLPRRIWRRVVRWL
jgi:hypothetical protein